MLHPGEYCHHEAREPHSTRAPPSEPVLWLYFWCGEVAGEYWFVENEPFKLDAIKHWAKLR